MLSAQNGELTKNGLLPQLRPSWDAQSFCPCDGCRVQIPGPFQDAPLSSETMGLVGSDVLPRARALRPRGLFLVGHVLPLLFLMVGLIAFKTGCSALGSEEKGDLNPLRQSQSVLVIRRSSPCVSRPPCTSNWGWGCPVGAQPRAEAWGAAGLS